MIGKTVALVLRAFRVDARDWRSHAFRALLAGFILWILATSQITWGRVTAPGLSLFSTVAWLNYWFITVAGATFFASAITEEKEERTLSLLKMADIGPMSILMGKWLPRLTGAMFLVLVQIPFTALAVTLGGILWHQVLATYASLLAHLLMVGSLGLLASVYFSRTNHAVTAMAVFLAAYYIAPSLAKGIAQAYTFATGSTLAIQQWTIWACDLLIATRSDQQLGEALAIGFQFSLSELSLSNGLIYQIVTNVVAAGLCFLVSWLIFEPCTRNEIEPSGESVWLNNLRHMGRKGHQRRVWSWPIVWKDFHYIGGGFTVNLIKGILYLLFLAGFCWLVLDGRNVRLEEVGAVFAWWSIFFLIVESAILVSRVYREELQRKTWPTLTLIPMSIPELAYHKLAGAFLALIPAGACFAFGILCNLEGLADALGELFTEGEAFVFFGYTILQFVLAYHIAALLSIIAKWAIWPMAIFVAGLTVIIGNVMVLGCLSAILIGGGSDAWAGLMLILSLITLAVVVALHITIGRRLAELACAE